MCLAPQGMQQRMGLPLAGMACHLKLRRPSQ